MWGLRSQRELTGPIRFRLGHWGAGSTPQRLRPLPAARRWTPQKKQGDSSSPGTEATRFSVTPARLRHPLEPPALRAAPDLRGAPGRCLRAVRLRARFPHPSPRREGRSPHWFSVTCGGSRAQRSGLRSLAWGWGLSLRGETLRPRWPF